MSEVEKGRELVKERERERVEGRVGGGKERLRVKSCGEGEREKGRDVATERGKEGKREEVWRDVAEEVLWLVLNDASLQAKDSGITD